MKITESRLKQVIAEEYKRVVLINEMKQGQDYQRLVEIVGRERADLIIEGFFDFDWIPGSAANKMRKVLNALKAAENEAEIQAIFDRLPNNGEQVKAAISNAARSSSDPAAPDAVEDIAAATDGDPSTKPDDDQKAAEASRGPDDEGGDVNHAEVMSPEQAKESEEDSQKLAQAYQEEFRDAGLTTRTARPLDYLIRNYLIDFLKYKKITSNKGIDASPELKPERSIAMAYKINKAKKASREGMKYTGKDPAGRTMVYTITGKVENGKIPVATTRDGKPDPLKFIPAWKLDDLTPLQENKNTASNTIESMIKEELQKHIKG